MKRSLESVLIKPAGPDCNLACRYCFYLNKSELFPDASQHRMPVEVLEELNRQMFAQPLQNLSFNWQGGEPTLMGLEFFEKAVSFQQRYGRGQTVSNTLQTNGLLLDDKWCRFLSRYRFLVGLSLDGPQQIHDYYRKSIPGEGSYNRVIEKYRLLQESGVDVNVLSVLTDRSVKHIKEIYQHHKNIGLNFMQFIPCLESAAGQIQPYSLSPDGYGQALCELFDLWIGDFEDGRPTTSIRQFESLFFHYVGLEPPDCTMRQECGVYLVLEHNGDIFPCDFYVNQELKLGNILRNNLVEVFNSAPQFEFGLKKRNLPEQCLECQWLHYCRGGCPKERIVERKNYFCSGLTTFFQHSQKQFQLLAARWKAEQKQSAAPKAQMAKPGRNSPCICGSGLKFKKCCGK